MITPLAMIVMMMTTPLAMVHDAAAGMIVVHDGSPAHDGEVYAMMMVTPSLTMLVVMAPMMSYVPWAMMMIAVVAPPVLIMVALKQQP